jgi:glutamate-1-semialdehyde 2,1-aminomutase
VIASTAPIFEGEYCDMNSSDYETHTPRSKQLYESAKSVLPGGTSYQIRYFEPYPFQASRAKGSRIFDADGNEFIDYWCTHFALILGHSHPKVVEALKEQIQKGYHFGVPHEQEIELAELIAKTIPSAHMVRFTNSGTEANMYAVRLARTCTKREKIGKFEGNWHGGYDALHVAVHPPLDSAQSGGLTSDNARHTIVLPYNDVEGTRKKIRDRQIACILVEPLMGGGGMIPAERDFLQGLRELCDETGALLIFDEVVTGFRLGLGGAQQFYGVLPDLTILGKILGGGLPVGAVAGRADVMEHLDQTKYEGEELSYIGGTGIGNALSMAAGVATIEELRRTNPYPDLDRLGQKARQGLDKAFKGAEVDIQITGLGSTFGCHFNKGPVRSIHDSARNDVKLTQRFHRALLDSGIFMLTPHTLHGCISTAHNSEDIEKLIAVAEKFARMT